MSLPSTITLADTDVTRIGLGTNRLTPDNVDFVKAAVEAGVEHIDTAHLYTSGQSEATIGEAREAGVDPRLVATKGGYRPGEGKPEVLRSQIEESLRRLNADSIDLYYLHRVDPDTPLEESLGAIAEQRDAGKIRHVGVSDVSVAQIEQARQVVPVAAVQNQYSLSERGYDDVVDHCTEQGIPFVPYFPLRGVGGSQLDEIAGRHDASPRQIALAWLLHRSPVMLPIPGTLSIEHLRENLGALEVELTDADLDALG